MYLSRNSRFNQQSKDRNHNLKNNLKRIPAQLFRKVADVFAFSRASFFLGAADMEGEGCRIGMHLSQSCLLNKD